VCTENLVRIELVIESLPLAGMIALIFLALNPLAAIVKSKRRLEAEKCGAQAAADRAAAQGVAVVP
jgi:hypothetical protein